MLKKIFLLVITIILVIGMCGSVNAEELKTKLDIIQQASETKYLESIKLPMTLEKIGMSA